LVLTPNPRWIVNPWPAIGTRLFIEDLLLRFAVRQFVLEARGSAERGYDGFGPIFASEANQIGTRLKLAQVVARNRTGENFPLAKYWPHTVWLAQDPRRYGNDVTEELHDLAAGTTNAPRQSPAAPSLGTWELVLLYLSNGKVDRLLKMAADHLDRLHDLRTVK